MLLGLRHDMSGKISRCGADLGILAAILKIWEGSAMGDQLARPKPHASWQPAVPILALWRDASSTLS